SFIRKISLSASRADLIGPKKLISRDGVDRDRNNKESNFNHGNFFRTVAEQQKEHPRQQHHCVAIRKFPAAGISVRPKGQRQQTNRDPNRRFVESAFAKDQNKKWADEENRTTERSEANIRKIRRVAKSFKEHFVNVPGNRVKREEAV